MGLVVAFQIAKLAQALRIVRSIFVLALVRVLVPLANAEVSFLAHAPGVVLRAHVLSVRNHVSVLIYAHLALSLPVHSGDVEDRLNVSLLLIHGSLLTQIRSFSKRFFVVISLLLSRWLALQRNFGVRVKSIQSCTNSVQQDTRILEITALSVGDVDRKTRFRHFRISLKQR